jgi:PPK2 family polyphosphate:nucleotide phosphotransferase
MNELSDNILKLCRVPAGKRVHLKDFDPAWCGDKRLAKKERREFAEKWLAETRQSLSEAQELLYAADTWSVLIIFQAMDAAGKDSTIKHVMSGINPQGCQVCSFKRPSSEELDHDFLWRCVKALPERGRIGIFNRSYYEEVLVVKVHPEILKGQKLPEQRFDEGFWRRRYESINSMERHLVRNGTRIVKLFLHVSKEEQRSRFLERLENPDKHWKFEAADLNERAFWNDYMRAYEEMLSATSTEWAPWHIVPADHKWASRAIVAQIAAAEIASLNLKYPELGPEQKDLLAKAKAQLEAEE